MKYLLLVMLLDCESREAFDLDAVLRRGGIANSSQGRSRHTNQVIFSLPFLAAKACRLLPVTAGIGL